MNSIKSLVMVVALFSLVSCGDKSKFSTDVNQSMLDTSGGALSSAEAKEKCKCDEAEDDLDHKDDVKMASVDLGDEIPGSCDGEKEDDDDDENELDCKQVCGSEDVPGDIVVYQ